MPQSKLFDGHPKKNESEEDQQNTGRQSTEGEA